MDAHGPPSNSFCREPLLPSSVFPVCRQSTLNAPATNVLQLRGRLYVVSFTHLRSSGVRSRPPRSARVSDAPAPCVPQSARYERRRWARGVWTRSTAMTRQTLFGRRFGFQLAQCLSAGAIELIGAVVLQAIRVHFPFSAFHESFLAGPAGFSLHSGVKA